MCTRVHTSMEERSTMDSDGGPKRSETQGSVGVRGSYVLETVVRSPDTDVMCRRRVLGTDAAFDGRRGRVPVGVEAEG